MAQLMGLETADLKAADPEKVLRDGIAIYRKLADERPGDVGLLRELGSRSAELSRLLRSAGREDESRQAAEDAEGAFTQAVHLKPAAWESWSDRAFVRFHRQLWESAAADFSKAIELAPQVHTNWWHRGHCDIALTQWDKAAADFGKVIDQWPDGSEGWWWHAVALAQLNQPEKAVADLRQAVAKGFQGVDWLKADSRLDPLRGREDFGAVLQELERKKK